MRLRDASSGLKFTALSHAWAFICLFYMAYSSDFGFLILPVLPLAALSFIKRKRVPASKLSIGLALLTTIAVTVFAGSATNDAVILLGINKPAYTELLALLTVSFLLIKFDNEPPILLPASSGIVLVAATMSTDFQAVGLTALIGTILLILALQESQNFSWASGTLVPTLVTIVLAAIFATTLKLSETRLSSLLYLFAVVPASGIQFPTTSSLNSIQRWESSDIVALRVYGNEAPPYLIGRTFSYFDESNTWKWTAQKKEALPNLSQVSPLNPYVSLSAYYNNPNYTASAPKAARIEYPQSGSGYTLYAPRYFSILAGDMDRLTRYNDGCWQAETLTSFSGNYFLYPYPNGWVEQGPPAELSSQEQKDSLQLPTNLTPKIKSLAQQVAGKYKAPEEKARRITNFFQTQFTYGYGYPFKSAQTALEEFLTERPAAHCEFFATATTLMLRSQGVPARYINGFVVQEQSLDGSYYVIRLKHAHAWVEAYLPHKGWTTFDPTPPGTLGDPEAQNHSLKALLERASNAWRHLLSWFTLSPQELITRSKALFMKLATKRNIGWFSLFAAILGIGYWRKHRSKPPKSKDTTISYSPGANAELTPLLEELQSYINPLDWQRKSWESLQEWLQRLHTSNLAKSTLDDLCEFIFLYEQERYRAAQSPNALNALLVKQQKLKAELKGMSLDSREPQALQ